MATLKHSDLFDFEAYESHIKSVKAASLDFASTMEGAVKRISSQQKILTSQLKEYAALLKGFNVSTPGAGAKLGGVNTGVSGAAKEMSELKAVQQGLASITNLHRASVEQLEAEYKGLSAQIKRLRPDSEGYEANLARINARLQQVAPRVRDFNAAQKAQIQILSAAEGSYRQMQSQLGFLRTQLRDMPNAFNKSSGAINKNNKEAVALNKEISRLDTSLKGADKSMGLYFRNVGNYSSAIKGFSGNIVGYATQILSISAIFGVLSKSLDVSKRFEALNAAMAAVSTSGRDLANNQEFLRVQANKYGQDIFVLSDSFKKLSAATKGTKLEGAQAKNIFDALVGAGATLKLSNDEVAGALNAVQQMISKGNVNAEELRGQLGERLPGAFRIFAQSMGKNEMQLNKMLEQGQVLAADTLPKFADALRAAYPVDGATALVNETNRLNNAWNEFLNSKKVVAFWGEVTRGLTTFIADFNFWLNSDDAKFFDLVRNTGKGRTAVTDMREAEEKKAADRQKAISDFQLKNVEDRNKQLIEAQDKYNAVVKKEGELDKQRTTLKTAATRLSFAQDKIRLANEKKTAGEWLGLLQETHDKQSKIELQPGSQNPQVDAAAQKALTAFKKRIDEQQKLLKEGYELDVAGAQLAVELKEMTEQEFQQRKFNLSEQYVNAAIKKERELGKNADEAKIIDLKKFLVVAERERLVAEERFYQKLRSKTRTGMGEADQSQFQKGTISVGTSGGGNKQVAFNNRPDIAGAIGGGIGDNDPRLKAQIDSENKSFAILQAGHDTSFKEEMNHLKKLRDAKIKFAASTAEEDYAIAELNARRKQELETQTQEFIFNAIGTGLNMLAENAAASSERRIGVLENEKQRELDLAGNNAVAREQIEKKFNDRIKKEKVKQAKQEKMYALFNVGVNTAVAVGKTIATWGMPWAIPFIALAIGTGLVQAAAIAAKPIPAFKKGTKNAPQGVGIVGEEGFEIMERDGKFVKTPNRASLVNLKGGEKIYTHEASKHLIEEGIKADETNRIIQTSILQRRIAQDITRSSQSATMARLASAIAQNHISEASLSRSFENAISELPVLEMNWNERGYNESLKRKNQRINYLNSRHGG